MYGSEVFMSPNSGISDIMMMMMIFMTIMISKVHFQKWFTLRRSTMKTLRCSSALSMDSACEKKGLFHIFKWQLPVDSAFKEAMEIKHLCLCLCLCLLLLLRLYICHRLCVLDSPKVEVIKHKSPFQTLSKVVAGHTHLGGTSLFSKYCKTLQFFAI